FLSLLYELAEATRKVLQTVHGPPDANAANSCLQGIHDEAGAVVDESSQWSELLTLSTMMKDKSDEELVLQMLRSRASVLLMSTALARLKINGYIGICPAITAANVKGQTIIEIMTRMNGFLASLANRLGSPP